MLLIFILINFCFNHSFIKLKLEQACSLKCFFKAESCCMSVMKLFPFTVMWHVSVWLRFSNVTGSPASLHTCSVSNPVNILWLPVTAVRLSWVSFLWSHCHTVSSSLFPSLCFGCGGAVSWAVMNQRFLSDAWKLFFSFTIPSRVIPGKMTQTLKLVFSSLSPALKTLLLNYLLADKTQLPVLVR